VSHSPSTAVEDRMAIEEGAIRWMEIIKGNLPAFNINPAGFAASCGFTPDFPTVADDLSICSKVEFIDGQFNVLGSAGPMTVRPSSVFGAGTTIVGRMNFDSADIALMRSTGSLFDVILHEIGHVLGIGTLWSFNGLNDGSGGVATCDSYSTNSRAAAEYRAVSGCASGAPPIEDDTGRAGTDCGHWDESCFGTELMTGTISLFSASTQPLSRMTIATLEDIGYTVDYSTADSYTAADMASFCKCTSRRLGAPEVEEGGGGRRHRRRQLTEENLNNAIAYGQSILANFTGTQIVAPGNEGEPIEVYKVVVFYEQDGFVHDVHVTADGGFTPVEDP